jgi:hypothetical protein
MKDTTTGKANICTEAYTTKIYQPKLETCGRVNELREPV